ncbi:hypothetical protein Q7P37_000080 [Cladosporium fusiforme]
MGGLEVVVSVAAAVESVGRQGSGRECDVMWCESGTKDANGRAYLLTVEVSNACGGLLEGLGGAVHLNTFARDVNQGEGAKRSVAAQPTDVVRAQTAPMRVNGAGSSAVDQALEGLLTWSLVEEASGAGSAAGALVVGGSRMYLTVAVWHEGGRGGLCVWSNGQDGVVYRTVVERLARVAGWEANGRKHDYSTPPHSTWTPGRPFQTSGGSEAPAGQGRSKPARTPTRTPSVPLLGDPAGWEKDVSRVGVAGMGPVMRAAGPWTRASSEMRLASRAIHVLVCTRTPSTAAPPQHPASLPRQPGICAGESSTRQGRYAGGSLFSRSVPLKHRHPQAHFWHTRSSARKGANWPADVFAAAIAMLSFQASQTLCSPDRSHEDGPIDRKMDAPRCSCMHRVQTGTGNTHHASACPSGAPFPKPASHAAGHQTGRQEEPAASAAGSLPRPAVSQSVQHLTSVLVGAHSTLRVCGCRRRKRLGSAAVAARSG